MQVETADDRVVVRDGVRVLVEYVHRPTDAPRESPRPYALLRTRAGEEVTAYRPADHVWHKGLSLALPVVGSHNFWGGPTYVHGEGYVQLPNNGAQVHRGFRRCAVDGDGCVRLEQELDWVAEDGALVFAERRTLTARVVDATAWALTWRSALRNVSADVLGVGSPTSKGRENAGYAGIFWRGPTTFTGGRILAPAGALGDAARGEKGPWLAFVPPHSDAGVLVLDASDPVAAGGNPWFARTAEYAGLNPAPFFYAETPVSPGEELVIAAALIVGDARVASLAASSGASLVAELRSSEVNR